MTRGANPFFVDNFRVKRSVIYGGYDLDKFKKNLAVFREEKLECASPDAPDQTPAAEASTSASPAGRFRSKALALEKAGDPYKALYYWKVVEALDPADPSLAGIIQALETKRSAAAQRHFNKGEAHFKKNRSTKARASFLTALRCDPYHEGALAYVKETLHGAKVAFHKVKKGEDLKKIARKFYGDPAKDFLIARFNDLSPGEEPRPGARLRLPLLTGKMRKKRFDVEKGMAAAGALLAEQRHMEAAAAAEKILKHDPAHAGAAELIVAAYHGMGAAFLREGRTAEALAMARSMLKYDPDNKDAADLMNDAHRRMGAALLQEGRSMEALSLARDILKEDPGNEDAVDLMNDARHQKGVALLRGGKPLEALTVAGEILENDPNNEVGLDLKNVVYYQTGKNRLQENKPLEALKMFELAAPTYKDVQALASETRQALKARADLHYRNGVKHFVHERLEGAIMEWSKALALNPEHEKAKRDLENARKLVEKLKMIE